MTSSMGKNVTGDAITKHHLKNLVFLTLYYRADYWKSQEKKYCDFCKCWIADNKPVSNFNLPQKHSSTYIFFY